MKVKYAGTWLAPGGKFGARNVLVNGAPALRVRTLLRAAAVKVLGGDNKQDTFSFEVSREMATLRLSERAVLGELAWRPARGQLEVVCGAIGDEETFFLDAGLAGVERTYHGVMPALRYNFVGGLWTTDGTTIISEDGDMKGNKILLTEGDEAKEVVYAPALGAPPRVVQCSIVPPDGGEFINCWPLKSSTASTTGFVAVFAVPIPGPGYELHWTVVQ